MRAGDLIGTVVHDRQGQPLGRVADLIAHPDDDGRLRITHVFVTPRWRGRLFGYERPEATGPWLLRVLARGVHRGAREVEWAEVRWS